MAKSVVEQDIEQITDKLKKQIPMLSGKVLLISGGTGFIGSYILKVIAHLNRTKLEKPCRVISIDNYLTSTKKINDKEFLKEEFSFIEHDITKPLAILERIDFIIHAAGVASPIYYQKFPLETIETAIWGAKNLLELAKNKKVKSFLYFSSSEIYGDPSPDKVPTPESYHGNVSTVGDRACYDESKRLGETLCMTYRKIHDVPIKIVRPFNIFGPGMKSMDYRVVPTFLHRGLQGKYLPVHDKGNQTRTFCYIADAIEAFFLVLLSSKNGEVYNVGNDENEINMMSLAETIARLFKNKPEVRMIAYPGHYPSDEPKRRSPDLSKIRKELGYKPHTSLLTGLKRTLRWCRENY